MRSPGKNFDRQLYGRRPYFSGTRFPSTPSGIDANMMQSHPKNGFRSRFVSIKIKNERSIYADRPSLSSNQQYDTQDETPLRRRRYPATAIPTMPVPSNPKVEGSGTIAVAEVNTLLNPFLLVALVILYV